MSLHKITDFISRATSTYPSLEMVVFTGGECFLLKNDLYEAISYCTSLGLSSRCVSNGYWGKTKKKADEIARKVINSGLSEINFNTGLDHQEWVPLESVVNACESLVDFDIPVLITIEKDSEESDCFTELVNENRVKNLLKEKNNFSIQTNSWMPFHETSVKRGHVDQSRLRSGCDQVFDNLVLTPKKEIASCCGLTLEHIPEMRAGIGEITPRKRR